MATREELITERAECVETRNLYKAARNSLASGGTSYTIKDGDSLRQLTRANISDVQTMIDRMTYRINEIDYMLSSSTLSKPARFIIARGI